MSSVVVVFFFQAEDGIRDWSVTGVQTCALPILPWRRRLTAMATPCSSRARRASSSASRRRSDPDVAAMKIGRASCRERGEDSGGAVSLKKKEKERSRRDGAKRSGVESREEGRET